jgi:GxxExxY protein
LSRDILAAAMKIHSTLKPGLDEKLYENALLIELVSAAIARNSRKVSLSTTMVISSEK